MSRYDRQLAGEGGAVRAGLASNRNDYRAPRGYDRDFGGRGYRMRPDEIRGDMRAGSAYSYGVGNDAGVVDWHHGAPERPRGRPARRAPEWQGDRAWREGYWSGRYGNAGYDAELTGGFGGTRYVGGGDRNFGGRGQRDWRDATHTYDTGWRRYDSGYRRW